MKKSIVATFLLIFVASCCVMSFFMPQAAAASSIKSLQAREGKWYDHDTGKLILEIRDGKINGIPVVKVFGEAGSATIGMATYTLQDRLGKTLDLELECNGYGIHKHLIVNRHTALFPSPEPQYYESVDGVYLGMTESALLKAWGNPTKKMMNGKKRTWYYKKKGVVIRFHANMVDLITLLKESPYSFDKSGLNCSSLDEEFESFYGFSSSYHFWPYNDSDTDIRTATGHDEYLFSGSTGMKRAEIRLTIYPF